VSTAAKQVFYSLKDKKGGDAITLVSRVKGREARRAAEMIGTQFGAAATIPRPQPPVEGRNTAFNAASAAPPARMRPTRPLEPLGLAWETLRRRRPG